MDECVNTPNIQITVTKVASVEIFKATISALNTLKPEDLKQLDIVKDFINELESNIATIPVTTRPATSFTTIVAAADAVSLDYRLTIDDYMWNLFEGDTSSNVNLSEWAG